jgi:hypothetical protein
MEEKSVFPGTLLIISFVAACANGAQRQDELFAPWREVQRGVKSLIVRFSLETRDSAFRERQKAEGTFRLLRTPKGELFASYEVNQADAKGNKQVRGSGLFNNGAVYLLDHDKKIAIRFQPTSDTLQRFLEKYFNPFVLLLDQERATAKCQVEVVQQDEWHSYLAVKPKRVKRFGWFPDTFQKGRIILMNKNSEAVPKDMPRQLWYTDGAREYTFDIQTWRLNVAEPPKPEEFAKPETRPGWEVMDWPFRSEK